MPDGSEYLLGFGVDPASFAKINEDLSEGIKGAVTSEINVVLVGDVASLKKALAKPLEVEIIPDFNATALKKLKATIEQVFAGGAQGGNVFGKDVKQFQVGASALERAVGDLKALNLGGFTTDLAKQVGALHAALNQTKALGSGGAGTSGGGGKNAARNTPRDDDTTGARPSMAAMNKLDEQRAKRDAFRKGYFSSQHAGYEFQTERRQLPPQPENLSKGSPYYRTTERFKNTTFGRIPRTVTLQDIESSYSVTGRANTEVEDRFLGGIDQRAKRAKDRDIDYRVKKFGYTSPTSFDPKAKENVRSILRDLEAIKHDTETALYLAQGVEAKDIGGLKAGLAAMEAELKKVNNDLKQKQEPNARRGMKIRKGDLEGMIAEHKQVQVARQQMMIDLQQDLGGVQADIDHFVAEETRIVGMGEKIAQDARNKKASDMKANRDAERAANEARQDARSAKRRADSQAARDAEKAKRDAARDAEKAKKDAEKQAREDEYHSRSDNWLLGQQGGNFMASGEGAVSSYQHDRGRYIDPTTGKPMTYGEIERIDRRRTKYGELPYRMSAFDQTTKERIVQDIMGAPQALEDINKADRLRKAEERAAERQGAIPGSVWMTDKGKANASARLGQERVRLVQHEVEQLQWAETSINTVLRKLEADKVKLIAEGAAEEVLALKEGDAAAARQLGENIAHDRALREKQYLELVEEGEKLNAAAEEANAPGAKKGRHGRGLGGAFTNMWQYALVGGVMYGAQAQARQALGNAITTDDDTWQYKHATPNAEGMHDWDAFFKKTKDASRSFSVYFAKDQKEVQEAFTETYRLTDPAADKWARFNTALLATAKAFKFTAITGGDMSETLKAMNAAAAGLGTTLHSTSGRMDDILGKVVALSAHGLTGEAGSRQGIKTEGMSKGILDMLARTGAAGRSLGFSDDYQLGLAATLEQFAPGQGSQLGALVAKLYASLPKAGGHLGLNHTSPRFGTPFAEGDFTHMIPQIAADMQGAHSGDQLPNNVLPLIQIMRQKGFSEALEKNVTLSRGAGGGALDTAFEQRMETVQQKIARMRYEWEALSAALAEKFLPVIANIADKVTDLIASFQHGSSAASNLLRALLGFVVLGAIFKLLSMALNGLMVAFGREALIGSITSAKEAMVEFFSVGLAKGAFLVGMMALISEGLVTVGRTARDQEDEQAIAAKRKEIGSAAVDFREAQHFGERYIRKGTAGNLWGAVRQTMDDTFGGGVGISDADAEGAVEAEAKLKSGGVVGWGNLNAHLLRTGIKDLTYQAGRLPEGDPRLAKINALLAQAQPLLDTMDRTGTNGSKGGIEKLTQGQQHQALGVIEQMKGLVGGGDWQGTQRNFLDNLGASAGDRAKNMLNGMFKGVKGAMKDDFGNVLKDAQKTAAAAMGQEQAPPDEASNTWEARLAAFRTKVAAFGTAMDAIKEKQDDYRHHTDMARMAVEGLAAQEQALNQIYQGRKIPLDELRHELKLQQQKLAAQLEYVGAIREEARMGQYATFRAEKLASMVPAVEWAPGDAAGPSLAGKRAAGGAAATALPGGGALVVLPRANVAGMSSVGKAGLASLRAFLVQAGEHGTITSANDGHLGVSSRHNLGLAADMQLANRAKMPEFVGVLRSKGFDASFERKGQVNANGSHASGDHIHIDFGRAASGGQAGMVTTSVAADQHQVAQILASTMNFASRIGSGPLGAINIPYAGMLAFNDAMARQRAQVGQPGAAITAVGGVNMSRSLMGDAQQNETVKTSEGLRHTIHHYLLAADKEAAQMKVTLIQQSAAVEKIVMEMAETEGQILSRPFADAIDKRAEALRIIEEQYKEHNRMLEDAGIVAQLYGDNIDGVRIRLKNTSEELEIQTERLHRWKAAYESSTQTFEGVQRLAFAAGEGNIHFGLNEDQQGEAAKRAALMKQSDIAEGRTPLKNGEYLGRAQMEVEKKGITEQFLGQLQKNGINVKSVGEFYKKYQGFFRRIGAPEWIESVLRDGGFSEGSLNALGKIRDKAKDDRDKNEGLFTSAHQQVGQLTDQTQQLGNKELFDRWKDDLDDCARDMKLLNDHMSVGKELATAMGVEFERTPAFLADSTEMLGHMVEKAELLKQSLKDLDLAEVFSKPYYKLLEQGASPEQAQGIMRFMMPGGSAAPPPSQHQIDDQRDKTRLELSGTHQEIVQRVMSRIGQRPYAYDLINNTQMLGMSYERDKMMASYSPDSVRDIRDARGRYIQGLQGATGSAMDEAAKRIVDQTYRAVEIKSRLDEMVKAIQDASAANKDTTEAALARNDIEKQLTETQAETVKQQALYNDALAASIELQKIAKKNEEVRFYQDTIKNATMDWATGRGVNSRGRRGESVLADRFREAFRSIGGAIYEKNISQRIDGMLQKFFGSIGLKEQEAPQIKAQNTNTDAITASTKAIQDLTKTIQTATGQTPGGAAPGASLGALGSSTSTTDSSSGFGAAGAMASLGLMAYGMMNGQTPDVQDRTAEPTSKIDSGAYRAEMGSTGARNNKGKGKWGAEDYGAALGSAFGAWNAGANSGGGVVGALMGAGQGAMIGAQFGPIGMAAGATIGLLGSIFGSGEKHRQVTEKIFNQMPRRQDVLYAAGAYLPFSAYAGGRFSRFEFAVNLNGLMVSNPAHAQMVGQAITDGVAPMVRAQFARGPITMRGT